MNRRRALWLQVSGHGSTSPMSAPAKLSATSAPDLGDSELIRAVLSCGWSCAETMAATTRTHQLQLSRPHYARDCDVAVLEFDLQLGEPPSYLLNMSNNLEFGSPLEMTLVAAAGVGAG